MILFENVSKHYRDKNISLHGVNIHVRHGEFVSLVGSSGAGKSTLLRLLLAEEFPTEGSVYFDGINVHNLRDSDVPRYRQRIGVVFQDFKLLENKTAYENVAFAMEMIGKDDEEIRADVPYALELVGLADKMASFPGQLSRGEQQRLAIARAIINQPDLLIADEPTASLDPDNTDLIVSILKKVNEMGTTILLASHDPYVVNGLEKRVLTIERGEIISDEKKGKFHQQTKHKK